MLQEFTDTAIDFTETVDDGPKGDDSIDESSAPIVRLVQLIISEAVQARASDIHIEPFESRIRVRYRIDGMLIERDSPPKRLLGAVLSRERFSPNSTLPNDAAPRTGASRSPWAKKNSTCG